MKAKHHILRAVWLGCWALLGASAALAQAPLEFNVKARSGSPAASFLAVHSEQASMARIPSGPLRGLDRAQALSRQASGALEGIYTLRFSGRDSAQTVQELMATGHYEYVEANRVRTLHRATAEAPDDARIEEQWYHAYIRTFEAWDTTRGSSQIKIGVLDTGIDYGHPEFEGQLAVNAAEDLNGDGRFQPWPDTVLVDGQSGDLDGLDQDGNGYADDVIGWDFTDQPRSPFGGDYLGEDADPLDDNNHGTLVGGIIAARADNQYGGAGIAPGCRLVTLRAFSASGSGEDDDIARAIVYAADNGIPILNFSFGDIYPSQTMHAAIRYAYARGVVMVASAGNGTGDQLHYPSNFDEVISVSATTLSFDQSSELLWPLSSYGTAVSLAAPGANILCPIVRDTAEGTAFDFFSGTSTAAPMVSAAVGLLFAQRGICSPQQVRGILTASADDVSLQGWDHYTGAGRLNIQKALQTVAGSNVQLLSPIDDAGTASDSVWVVATALDPEGEAIFLEYEAGTNGQDNWIPILENLTTQVFRDTLGLWDLSGLPDGDYTLRLRMEKTNGRTAEDRIRFVLDRSPAQIDLRVVAPAWDNFEQKQLFVFRNSDRGRTSLHLKALGATQEEVMYHDRITRWGSFLLGMDRLTPGDYVYYLQCENESGLLSQTLPDTFSYQPAFAPVVGFDTLNYSLPMGHHIPQLLDLDNDGLQEIMMSRYASNLGFGKLMLYEYNGTTFSEMDSLDFAPVLIPKDVQDTDGDGLLELLCSVNDSLYVTEQSSPGSFPDQLRFSSLGNSRFPAQWADPDNDGQLEMLVKDFKDYFVWEANGDAAYAESATLRDDSPDYQGSMAPLVLVQDFDGDGLNEIVFGDFDGDLLIYEASGLSYAQVFQDTTSLTKSGSYLAAGDFDGDGQQEFAVAVNSTLNRNEADFEYEPAYWYLRIFKATGNNQYAVVWEQYFFDVDTENFNALTAGNLDQDAADELIFSSFPRDYVFDHDGSDYVARWFHYGSLTTHHVIGDFNGNGVNEVAIGRGDKAIFWEADFSYQGPDMVLSLSGTATGASTAELSWLPVGNASEYRLWRGLITGQNVFIAPIDSTTGSQLTDTGLQNSLRYLYVLEAKNPALNPVYSPFSNAVVITPHTPGGLDSITVLAPQTLQLHFDVPVRVTQEMSGLFRLDTVLSPVVALSSGDQSQTALLEFAAPLDPGTHLLEVDSLFRDALQGPLDPARSSMSFQVPLDSSAYAWFSQWRILSPQTARIEFNLPMDASVLDLGRWQVLPFGMVTAVRFHPDSAHVVEVELEGVALGALGYPVSITLNGGTALNGATMREKEGNTATFSQFQPTVDQAYVYPNPYEPHELFEGVRFANLSQRANVVVLSPSGRVIIRLEEADGDGAVEWDLRDQRGERVRPGIYLYKVTNPDAEGDEQVGSFSILRY